MTPDTMRTIGAFFIVAAVVTAVLIGSSISPVQRAQDASALLGPALMLAAGVLMCWRAGA